jgi:hypothetical protein
MKDDLKCNIFTGDYLYYNKLLKYHDDLLKLC